ncbi:LIM domain-binding protein 3 [Trichinella papuae]|uniref:LIM domain-binding protein 3 n=1 Tax=Trichinella papuae TaxID=268474 RepID=A0A0V1NAP8_9BILA|nr:LIM domain-binding protein 3 [Trichinella papuae]
MTECDSCAKTEIAASTIMTDDECNDGESCAKCNYEISSSAAALVLNNVYHPEHVICSKCEKCLDGFSMFVKKNNEPICLLCHKSTSVCKACNLALDDDVIFEMGEKWHRSCFVCAACKQPFMNFVYFIQNCKPYCLKHSPN